MWAKSIYVRLLTLSIKFSSLHSTFGIGEGLFNPTCTIHIRQKRMLHGYNTVRLQLDIQVMRVHSTLSAPPCHEPLVKNFQTKVAAYCRAKHQWLAIFSACKPVGESNCPRSDVRPFTQRKTDPVSALQSHLERSNHSATTLITHTSRRSWRVIKLLR